MTLIKRILPSLIGASLVFANASLSAQNLTPEQLRQLLQQQLGMPTQVESAPPLLAQRNAPAQSSEAALARQLAAWAPAQGPFAVERFRDGFSINGERVLDEQLLKALVEKHFRYTGSERAKELLADWNNARRRFVKVFPTEYKRALAEMYEREQEAGREQIAA